MAKKPRRLVLRAHHGGLQDERWQRRQGGVEAVGFGAIACFSRPAAAIAPIPTSILLAHSQPKRKDCGTGSKSVSPCVNVLCRASIQGQRPPSSRTRSALVRRSSMARNASS